MKIYIVKITDYEERPSPSTIDSLWVDYDNALFRKNNLNKSYSQDSYCNYSAELESIEVSDK